MILAKRYSLHTLDIPSNSVCTRSREAAASTSLTTLHVVIESFNAKVNQHDVCCQVFFWAYNVLLRSLQLTVSRLELQNKFQA